MIKVLLFCAFFLSSGALLHAAPPSAQQLAQIKAMMAQLTAQMTALQSKIKQAEAQLARINLDSQGLKARQQVQCSQNAASAPCLDLTKQVQAATKQAAQLRLQNGMDQMQIGVYLRYYQELQQQEKQVTSRLAALSLALAEKNKHRH